MSKGTQETAVQAMTRRMENRVTAWLSVALNDHNCHCRKCLGDYATELIALIADYTKAIEVMGGEISDPEKV